MAKNDNSKIKRFWAWYGRKTDFLNSKWGGRAVLVIGIGMAVWGFGSAMHYHNNLEAQKAQQSGQIQSSSLKD